MDVAGNVSAPKGHPGPALESSRKTLAARFLVRATVVLLAGMLIIGFWVTGEIEDGVTRNSASSTALYMGSIVAPQVQELATSDRLSAATRQALDGILNDTELGKGVVSFKVWKEGGLIVYSSRPSIIGKSFPVTDNLRNAWRGVVTAEFDTLVDEEDALERRENQPLLEMYVPIRDQRNGRIIAVAEFYEKAHALKQDLFNASLRSWLVVGGVTLMMVAALSGIVLRGSRTIELQREMLKGRVEELSKLLRQNEELRTRLQTASNRTAEINERYLRRLGADLHDGPAQSLALALLRLDALKVPHDVQTVASASETNDIDIIRDALQDAIREIREICSGLTLAKLEEMPPLAILRQIIGAHETRTGTLVTLDAGSIPATLPMPIKIGMFRFVQEALNNAFRHAGGAGQVVSCRVDCVDLEVCVSDSGPGLAQDFESNSNGGLGLIGLRERIEALGGSLRVDTLPGKGTTLVMRCNIDRIEKHNDKTD